MGRHPGFLKRALGFSSLGSAPWFSYCKWAWTKWALGPLISGSKDYGTHNAPFFPDWNFVFFQSGENIVLLYLRCGTLKGLEELMRTLNTLEGEVILDTKRVGSADFPICLWHMLS